MFFYVLLDGKEEIDYMLASIQRLNENAFSFKVVKRDTNDWKCFQDNTRKSQFKTRNTNSSQQENELVSLLES